MTALQFLVPLMIGTLLAVSNAFAAGFAITENSAKQLGVAFAGAGAVADDGSTVWFNPAGMLFSGKTLQVSGSYINPRFDFSDNGSVQMLPTGEIPLLPTSRRASGGGTSALVPNVFYVRPISERLSLGIGMNAPFGLTTKYDPNWIGRYHAVKSEIVTVNLNPSIAWRINSDFAVGGGININYMEATLTNAVDFAAVCAAAIGAPCPNGSAPGQGQFDGFARSNADDISIGYNLGMIWSPSDATRVGVAYRSQIDHTLTGNVDFTEPTSLGGFAALGPLGQGLGETFANGGNSAKVRLPDSASVSLFHRMSDRVSVVGDLTWTGWADIPELRINFDNPLTPTAVEHLGWQDALRAAAGVVVDLNDRWSVRGGYAYDQSPVPGPTDSTPRLPDHDRQWLAIGASHRLNESITVDFGYAHIFVGGASISRLESTGGMLNGNYSSAADILSLQFNYAMK